MLRSLHNNKSEQLLQGSASEDSDDEEEYELDQTEDTSHYSSSSESECDTVSLRNLKWKKKKFNSKNVPVKTPLPDIREQQPKSPSEYFEQYFTSDIYQQFAMATNQHYTIKNSGVELNPPFTAGEIKTFFGIHGMLGCFTYPRMKLFWNQRYRFDPIARVMTRDRFFLLRVNILIKDVHTVNEAEEQAKNKLWRVQPLIDAVRSRCLKLPRDVDNFSIDEQMISFGKRCTGLKVSVKDKPRPKGLKNYIVTTAEGKVLDFEIYQGQTTNLPDIEKFGMGPAIVLRLASNLPDGSFLYFDRYFTSLPLMQELVKRKKEGTGTLMMNRSNTKKAIKYEFKKDTQMKRGEHEEIVNADENICILKWKDNKGMMLSSTAFGSKPLTTVARWEKNKQKYIDVPCPAVVKNYNSYMRGAAIFDQMMETYRTRIKSKTWTLKVILHLYDLSIVNSWMEYREDCKAARIDSKDVMDFLEFRLSISEYLLAGAPKPAGDNIPEFAEMTSTSKYRPNPLPHLDTQMDGYNHLPVFDTLKNPRACRAPNCTSRSRCRCIKCDLYLCLTKDRNCFFNFHRS